MVIVFLLRSYFQNDWHWTKIKWFRFAFVFWIISLFSALLGPMPIFSTGEGFVWIRFPLYAVAVQYWLGSNRDIRVMMLYFIIIGMMLMSTILFLETIIEPKSNLTWPYGDQIPGSYLAKFCLPATCVLVAVAILKFSKKSIFSGVLFLISLFASLLTGERNNLIIRVSAALVAIFSYKINFRTTFFWAIIFLATIINLYYFNKTTQQFFFNFASRFFDYIPILNFDNTYWGTWRSGIQQWIETPFLGVGPSGTRFTCGYLENISWLPGENYCGNHPHNMFIQIFSETGLIGGIFFIFMIAYIFKDCLLARKNNPNCVMSCTAFIVPFAIFFPFQHAGSFFGQWNNLFIWFALGFVLSNHKINKKNYDK